MERTRQRASAETDISQEDAEFIWRDAAKLQAEAARKLEERSVEIAEGLDEHESDGASSFGFRIDEIRTVAEAAGISREFVELAILRLNSRKASGETDELEGGWAERLLNHNDRSIEVSRVIKAQTDEVYEAMKRVFVSPKYNLELVDVVGEGDDDRILVFGLPSMYSAQTSMGYTSFSMKMAHAGLKKVFVSIHPMGTNSCQVTVRADLAKPRRSHAIASGILLGVLAPLLAILPAAILAKTGLVTGFPLVVAYLISAFLLGSAELAGLRALFRWSVGKGEEGLTDLLKVVDTDARMKGDFRGSTAWPDLKAETSAPDADGG